jgi:hypothetical protein
MYQLCGYINIRRFELIGAKVVENEPDLVEPSILMDSLGSETLQSHEFCPRK